jgi:hypothetical protein
MSMVGGNDLGRFRAYRCRVRDANSIATPIQKEMFMRYSILLPVVFLGLAGCVATTPYPGPQTTTTTYTPATTTTYVTQAPGYPAYASPAYGYQGNYQAYPYPLISPHNQASDGRL